MKQKSSLIALSACLAIAACASDDQAAPTISPNVSSSQESSPNVESSPNAGLSQEGSPLEQADSEQAVNQNELPEPSTQAAASDLTSAGSLQTSTGSALTARVSDLSGLVTDLGGQITETEIIIDLPSDVLFDFDKADIRQDAVPTLEKLARLIGSTDSERVQINGHTDSKGADNYNMELSQRRTESVGAWLIEKGGISSNRLQTIGYGETKPVANNELPGGADDPAGRAKNRRVEVVILR
ncbi:MAG: OmpA family protein [Nodosilinea sp.]